MNRREFIKISSAFGAFAILHPAEAFAPKNTPLGIQLWSVRDAMSKDPKGTLKAIARQGYAFVEPFGYSDGKWFGLPASEFKSVVSDLGLKMPSCHYFFTAKHYDRKANKLDDEVKRSIDAAKAAGQKYMVLPYMLDNERDEESVKHLVEMMNKIGEQCKKSRLRFAYHNHDFEFTIKFKDGQPMYKYILEQTDPKLVRMEMDMGWVHRAGQRPLDWFNKYPGRFELSHMKDMQSTENSTSVIIGNGIVDFREIITNKKLAGMKHWIIELEHYQNGSVADAGICLSNLRKIMQ